MGTLTLTRASLSNRAFRNGRWLQIAYVTTDVFFVMLNALLVYSFRFGSDSIPSLVRTELSRIPSFEYPGFLLLYSCLIVLFCQSQDLYRTPRDRSAPDESLAVFQAIVLANVALIAFIYLSKQDISRLVVGLNGVLNVVTLAGWRLWKRRVIERRVASGEGVRNVLIVGAGKIGQALAGYLEKNKHLGYVVQGFLDQNHSSEPRILGTVADLHQIARTRFTDEIFITIPSERELVKAVVLEARRNRLDVRVVPDLYDGLGWRAPLEYLGEFPVMSLHWEPIPVVGLLLKRTMDFIFCWLGLILLSPLLAAIAIAIKLDSPGPVLYRSPRVGKKARTFVFYKFRTMVANADLLKPGLRRLNERQGPFFKIANDPRLTRVGRLLRKYSLDELPQLWNVLKGDMSLVGPRPHPTDDYEHYTLEHLRRLDVTPGMTGLWQVDARLNPSFGKNLELDLEYIENWNLWIDAKILLKTVPAIFKGSGL